MQQMIIPPALRPGSTVALVCPGGSTTEDRILATQTAVEAMGYKAYIHPQCYLQHGYFAGTDLERAAALNEMFADPQIDAIFAVRGGFGCYNLLDQLNYNIIAQNPKILMGMSDVTALSWAITSKTGLITFSGPSCAVFAGPQNERCQTWIKNMLEGQSRSIATDGSTTVIPGTAEGKLWGGSAQLIRILQGTDFTPNDEQILLFSEDVKQHQQDIDYMFQQLKYTGLLKKTSGVILGEWLNCGYLYNGQEGSSIPTLMTAALGESFTGPLVNNLPFGHGDLHCVIPIGAQARLTATPDSVTLELLHDVVKTS